MAKKYSKEQLLKAYKCASNNKKELEQSEKCGISIFQDLRAGGTGFIWDFGKRVM